MLPWKPAISREAVLTVQDMIRYYRHEVDHRELYFYILDSEFEAAAGFAPGELVGQDQYRTAWTRLGFSEEHFDRIYDRQLGRKGAAIFVPESLLKSLGMEVEWDRSQDPIIQPGRKRRSDAGIPRKQRDPSGFSR